MPKFSICYKETIERSVLIEAVSQAEAERKYLDDDFNINDVMIVDGEDCNYEDGAAYQVFDYDGEQLESEFAHDPELAKKQIDFTLGDSSAK